MSNTLNDMFKARENGLCPFCNTDTSKLTRQDFKDELSWREFNISGLCQKCQDKTFGDD